MAIYRQLQTSFWQNEYILELEPLEKYVYTYLMTNPRTTQCGIYRLVKKLMKLELGLEWETIYKILKKLMDDNKISYCEETGEIMLLNWSKYNFINSRNTILCINKELKEVKNKEFIDRLYTICLERNYPVEAIFKGIEVGAVNDKKEAGIVPLETFSEDIEDSIFAIEDRNPLEEEMEGLSSPFEAPYKPLGEEEIKEEIYINKSYNKQKVTNKSISRILLEFSKNIKRASKTEIEKFIKWRKTFEEEVIIKAIEQAVKYKAKHIGYIESIIKNWAAEGITTMKDLMKKLNRTKPRINSGAYRYVD